MDELMSSDYLQQLIDSISKRFDTSIKDVKDDINDLRIELRSNTRETRGLHDEVERLKWSRQTTKRAPLDLKSLAAGAVAAGTIIGGVIFGLLKGFNLL